MKNIISKLKKNDEYYGYTSFVNSRKWKENAREIVLCDISAPGYKPFYLGANIIDMVVNNSEFNCERAVWEIGDESMGWKTEKPIKSFGVIGICAYMYYQIFAIPAFLSDNKIQPLRINREKDNRIILLGGQMYYLFNGYEKFVDIACIGEGEDFILQFLKACVAHRWSKSETLEYAATNIPGAYIPSIHGTAPFPRIKKTFVEKKNLGNSLIVNGGGVDSKYKNKVIELARGCKYACDFCALSKRMFPFRENSIDDIKKSVSSFDEGCSIYPFAPDEASFSGHGEIAEWCAIKGMNLFRYNFRLDTINLEDIRKGNKSKQIVLGIDRISQRVIDITNKRISIKRLLGEVSDCVFSSDIKLLKLNYVFNYWFENDDDYKELEETWTRLVEKRIAAGSDCIIQIAPTPFTPEHFIPLQYAEIRECIDKRFIETYNRVKSYFFDTMGEKPRLIARGIQGNDNYACACMMHRIENLGGLVWYCYKNNYKKSYYDSRLLPLIESWLAREKISKRKLFEEIDCEKENWFDKLDWSAGKLDYTKHVKTRWKKIKERAERK
jgi:radical SAM superfamily enzyme YgiQ (UPF0313 family)